MKLHHLCILIIRSLRNRFWYLLLMLVTSSCAFYLLGNTLNQYYSKMAWIGYYDPLLSQSDESLYYLEYSRYPDQQPFSENSVLGEMFGKLRGLDGIDWFGCYQYTSFPFEELKDNSAFAAYALRCYPDASESFCQRGSLRLLVLYEDAWSLCKLGIDAQKEIPEYDDSNQGLAYIGNDWKGYFQVNDTLHYNSFEWKIAGVLDQGSRFLGPRIYMGVGSYIDLDQCVVIDGTLGLPEGLYNNFADATYFRFAPDADREQVTAEILAVLKEYNYYGWCKSVNEMKMEEEEEIKETSRMSLQLTGLIAVLAVTVLLTAESMSILSRKKEFGIWNANGVYESDIVKHIALELIGITVSAFTISAVILLRQIQEAEKRVNRGEIVYSLERFSFWTFTCWGMVSFGCICLGISILIAIILFKSFQTVKLLQANQNR